MSVMERPRTVEGSKKDRAKNPEKRRPTGHDTEVRLSFTRHSQKSTAVVSNPDGTISNAGISPAGLERAEKLGTTHKGRKLNKGYVTSVGRTGETIEKMLKGAGIEPTVLEEGKKASFFAFPAAFKWSKEFMLEYNKVMDPNKEKELSKPEYSVEVTGAEKMNRDEKVAEIAEEPAMDWWLQFGKNKPKDVLKDKDGKAVLAADDSTPSPYDAASLVGYKVNRLVNLTDRMPDREKVDLMSVGHKSSTEAFLKYVLQQKGRSKPGFDSLKEIGGSLRPLDSWDLIVKNDAKGKKKVSITITREKGEKTEYGVDLAALAELSKRGAEFLGEKTKKIDQASKPTQADLNLIEEVRKKIASFFKPKKAS